MVKAGETLQARGFFYKSGVQAFLIYRSDSWAIMDSMMKVLEGFHHCISRSILSKMERHVGVEGWEWPPMEEVLEAAGMWTVQEYVRWCQTTIE